MTNIINSIQKKSYLRNWNTKYPIKHPKLKIVDKDVFWLKPEDMKDEEGNRIEGVILNLFIYIYIFYW